MTFTTVRLLLLDFGINDGDQLRSMFDEFDRDQLVYLEMSSESSRADLVSFVECVRAGRFSGLFAVALSPQAEQYLQLVSESDITVELLRLAHSHYTMSSPAGALAMAYKLGRTGRSNSLLISTRPEFPEKELLPFWIIPRQSFTPTEALTLSRYRERFRLERGERLLGRAPYSVHHDLDLDELATYENASIEAATLLGKLADNTKLEARRSLPFRLLGAMRVARRLAASALEGSPLSCTVLLTPHRLLEEKQSDMTRLSKVINLTESESVPFDFDEWHRVRKLAEGAQSSDLVMRVDLATGLLDSVAVYRNGHGDRLRMYESLTCEADQECFALHIRDRFVELFAGGQLVLWYDGFQWVARPFATLTKVLHDFFDGGDTSRAVDDLRGAIGELMDSSRSCIAVLLHQDDDQNLTSIFRPMRDEFQSITAEQRVWTLSVPTLGAILRLDGAHVIDQNGRFQSIAQEINVPKLDLWQLDQACDAKKIRSWVRRMRNDERVISLGNDDYLLAATTSFKMNERDELKRSRAQLRKPQTGLHRARNREIGTAAAALEAPVSSGHEGSGRANAQRLSALLRNSWVVKVSAGGDLYVFRRGRKYRAPV